MLIDLGKMIGGPDRGEGDGLIGWVFGLFGGAAVLGGAAASGDGVSAGTAGMFDTAGGAARAGAAASEGIWSHVSRILNALGDTGFDYLIWRDIFGNKGSQQDFGTAWERMTGQGQRALREISAIVKGHSFILSQLKAHRNHTKIGDILTRYEALGMHLPSEELVKDAYRALMPLLTSGQNLNLDDELTKHLNNAKDALSPLKNEAGRAAYESALEHNSEAIEKLFAKLGAVDWKKVSSAIEDPAHLLAGGPAPEQTFAGARKWFSELSQGQRAGVMFGTVAAVGIGAYCAIDALDKRHKKQFHSSIA